MPLSTEHCPYDICQGGKDCIINSYVEKMERIKKRIENGEIPSSTTIGGELASIFIIFSQCLHIQALMEEHRDLLEESEKYYRTDYRE